MSGNQLRAQYESLNALEKEIDEHVNLMNGQIGQLNGIVDGIKAHWQGQGANAYTQLQHQVNEDAKRLKEVLAAIREAVNLAKGGFSATDEEQLQKFRGLTGGSGDNAILDRL